MAKNKRMADVHKPSTINHKPKKITPFCQLFRELKSQEEKDILFEQIEPLRDEYRDDLCLSILAYLKFGVPRVFDNHLMQVIYQAYIELIDRNRKMDAQEKEFVESHRRK